MFPHSHSPSPSHPAAMRSNVYMRCANDGRNDLAGHLFVAKGLPSLPCWPDQLQALPAPIGTPQGHPAAPTTTLRTVQALKEFFGSHAGYAQRSVAFGIEGEHRFQAHYQQREAAAEMHLELRAHGCHPDWTLSVVSGDPRGPLQLAPFPLRDGSAWVSVAAHVPAGYDDTLTLCIDTHGHPAPPDARVDLVLSVKLMEPAVHAPALCPAPATDGRLQPTLFRLGCHSWRAHPPSTDWHAHA